VDLGGNEEVVVRHRGKDAASRGDEGQKFEQAGASDHDSRGAKKAGDGGAVAATAPPGLQGLTVSAMVSVLKSSTRCSRPWVMVSLRPPTSALRWVPPKSFHFE